MESTRKDKEIHTNKGDWGWSLEYPESQAHRGPNTREGLKKKGPWYRGDPEHTNPNDKIGEARKIEFLTRVFDTLFAHDKYYGFSDQVNLVIDNKGDYRFYRLSEDNPFIDKTHVFYNSHYFIEVIPKEWEYSENGEEFFESQLENIKFIKLEISSYKHPRFETLANYVSDWNRRGFILHRFGEPFPPGVCHYCGKIIEGYDPTVRGRGAPKKTCDHHKTSLLSFERDYNKLLGEGKVSEAIIDLHDNSPVPRLELKRLLRPRCVVCGGVIPDDKPIDAKYCDGVCVNFETCNDPNKYSPGVMVGGGNNEYCVYKCPNRKVIKNKCQDAFDYRLKKERKTNPTLSREDLTMILKSERALGRQGYTISLAIKLRILKGQPLHGTPETDHYQELLGDEYDKMITRVTQEIQKVKNQK